MSHLDLLDFFVPESGRFPRLKADGHGEMNAVIDGQSITYIKWANPRACERYIWDDHGIYHVYDQGDEKGPFTIRKDGHPILWLKRIMSVGDVIRMEGVFRRYYQDSCQLKKRRKYRNRHKLSRYYPHYYAGGDMGTVPVIVLKSGNSEKFFYAKGWGWFAWEFWEPGFEFLIHRECWNYLGGPNVQPDPYCPLLIES